LRVQLTEALEQQIAQHITKICNAHCLLYNHDYSDVLAVLETLMESEDHLSTSYRRFVPLINIYREPMRKIPFLETLDADRQALQSIIKAAILSYFKIWLDTSFCEFLASEAEG
jgi:hypothetical protein